MKSRLNTINQQLGSIEETDEKWRNTPLDIEHLTRQTMGDEALKSEILALFLAQCRQCTQLLENQNTPKQITEIAHQINGCARSVGAWELANAAKMLEDNPNNTELLPHLHQQLGLVDKYISEML